VGLYHIQALLTLEAVVLKLLCCLQFLVNLEMGDFVGIVHLRVGHIDPPD
jgi:hypothetical protein